MIALRRALGTTVGVAAVALLVATTGFLLLQLVLFQPGRDQGIYSVVADGILRGLAPYRDRWDFKPPGIYFIYAAARALFGRTAMAARVVEAAALASGIGASAILSKRHLGDARPGWLAGSLAILNHVQLEFWHTGQPESFGGILLLWAIVFVGHRSASARRQHAAWAMGGALYACAGLLKPPLGGGMLVSAWLISRALRREGAPTRARLLALEAIFAGALLPVLATIAWFARHGALGDAIETLFVFAPGYTRLSLQSHSVWQLCAGTVRELVRVIAVPSLIGCALWALLPSGEAREGETPLHLIGALAPQLLGVALQAKLFPYHYGGIVPLAALFAGWGLWRIGRRLTHPAAALLGLMLLTLLVYESPPVTPDLPDFWTRCQVRIGTLLQPSRKIAADDRLYSVADVDAGANRRLAQWLRVHTAPQAPVFLWGFEPIVYTLADRAPATRYLYDVPQRARWSRERARRRMMADLAQAPPSAIVIERGDMLPLVTGDRLDSAQALLHFPELARLITESYHPAVRFERFDVYLRDQGAQR